MYLPLLGIEGQKLLGLRLVTNPKIIFTVGSSILQFLQTLPLLVIVSIVSFKRMVMVKGQAKV